MRLGLLFCICFLLFPFFSFAHGVHGNGILAGFTHPIFGLDHAVAIFGTGILGFMVYKNKWFYVFLAFLVPMVIGGVLGIGQEATFLIEKVIAFSVFALGIMILMNQKLPLSLVLLLLAAFGFFHGYAHGAEMPDMSMYIYIIGFAMGTFLLGVIGMLCARHLFNDEKIKGINYLPAGLLLGAGFMILLG